MSDLHPQWQTTGDDHHGLVEPVASSDAAVPVRIPVNGGSVSRAPAAIVGIGLSLAAGFIVAGGWTALSSQFASTPTSTETSVELTAQAPQPAAEERTVILLDSGITQGQEEMRLKPSETITFRNSSTIPQILVTESTTLVDSNGNQFDLTIFPNEEATFTVGPNVPSGEYEYVSTTTDNINGKIIIARVTSTPGSSGDSVFGNTNGVPLPSGEGSLEGSPTGNAGNGQSQGTGQQQNPADPNLPPAPFPAANEDPTTGTNSDGVIPVNPYAANGSANGDGNGQQPLYVGEPLSNQTFTQPESGPEVWVACAVSMAAFLWFCRKSLRSIA